jgi:hypothetical protein
LCGVTGGRADRGRGPRSKELLRGEPGTASRGEDGCAAFEDRGIGGCKGKPENGLSDRCRRVEESGEVGAVPLPLGGAR